MLRRAIPSIDIPLEFRGLFHNHLDRYLADDSLTDQDVIVLSVYFLEKKIGHSGVNSLDVIALFCSFGRKEANYFSNFTRVERDNLIEKNRPFVFLQIKGLKRVMEILGKTGKSRIYLINSGQHFTAIKLFEEFLSNNIKSDSISIFDPYISANTLHPFTVLKGKITKLRILTMNVDGLDKLKYYKEKFEKEMGVKIEIRENKKTHDRWLLNNGQIWSIGCSIKDIGNKDTSIYELEGIANSLNQLFEDRWQTSKNIV